MQDWEREIFMVYVYGYVPRDKKGHYMKKGHGTEKGPIKCSDYWDRKIPRPNEI